MTFNLETVKQHLRVGHDAEDTLIQTYMAAAVDYAETFLGCRLDDFGAVPAIVTGGLLVHTALMYECREMDIKSIQMDTIRLMYWPYRAVVV